MPANGRAINCLGNALAEQGDVDKAITQWEKSIALLVDNVEAHCNLGHTLADRGRFQDAATHFRIALQIDPTCATAHWLLGVTAARSLSMGAVKPVDSSVAT